MDFKVYFAQYNNGSEVWADWTPFLLSYGDLVRKVESSNPGEAGVITFDKTDLSFAFLPTYKINGVNTSNLVYTKFTTTNLDTDVRFLIRIEAVDGVSASKNIFEGMIDFGTIEYPTYLGNGTEHIPAISFSVYDKFGALATLKAESYRTYYIRDYYDSVPDALGYTTAIAVHHRVYDGKHYYDFVLFGFKYDLTWTFTEKNISSTHLYLEAGDIIRIGRRSLSDDALLDELPIIVVSAQYTAADFPNENWCDGTVLRIEGIPMSESQGNWTDYKTFPFGATALPVKVQIIDKAFGGNNNVEHITSGRFDYIDSVELIKSIMNKKWAGLTSVTNLATSEGVAYSVFKLPVHYAFRLLDSFPLGASPIDAIKEIANSMEAYVYFDRQGRLRITNKNYVVNNTTYRNVTTAKSSPAVKRHSWDKLVDTVEVYVKSWILDYTNDFFDGAGKQQTTVDVYERNSAKFEYVIGEDSLVDAGYAIRTSNTDNVNWRGEFIMGESSGGNLGVTSNPFSVGDTFKIKDSNDVWLCIRAKAGGVPFSLRYFTNRVIGTIYKPGEITKDIEAILNEYATYLAGVKLSFYGARRHAYDLTQYGVTLDEVDWELLDVIQINSAGFFTNEVTLSLADRSMTMTLIGKVGYLAYNKGSFILNKRQDGYVTGSGGGSTGSYSSSSASSGGLSALQVQTLIEEGLGTWSGGANIINVGTIVTGTWNASIIASEYGGTGYANLRKQLIVGDFSGLTQTLKIKDIDTDAEKILVSTDRSIATTYPLSGGGNLSANRTLSLNYSAPLAVSANNLVLSYNNPLYNNSNSLDLRRAAPLKLDGSNNLTLGYIAPFALSGNDLSLNKSAPLIVSSNNLTLDYNTTNLKLTSSKLNTIQDIATASYPQFAGLGIGNVGQSGYVHLGNTVKLRSANFFSGWQSGVGFDLSQDANSEHTLEIDNLILRGVLQVYELLINQIRATNGNLLVSSVAEVESYDSSYITFTDVTGHGVTPFAVNDVIMCQVVDKGATFNTDGDYVINGQLITRHILIVLAIDGTNPLKVFVSHLSGAPADVGTPKKGDAFVRLFNTTEANRRGLIGLYTDERYSPYMRITDGATSWADWKSQAVTKAQLGNLQGISYEGLALSGYGLYTENAYLKGHLVLTNSLSSINLANNQIALGNILGTANNAIKIAKTSQTNTSGLFIYNNLGEEIVKFAQNNIHKIAGWNINASSIISPTVTANSKSYLMELNASSSLIGNHLTLDVNGTVPSYLSFGRIKDGFGASTDSFGLAYKYGNLTYFELSETNKEIAGWQFNTQRIYKNNFEIWSYYEQLRIGTLTSFSPSSGAGIIMGLDSGAYKLYVGNTSNFIKWDGSSLSYLGVIRSSNVTSLYDTDAGVYIASDGQFRVGVGNGSSSITKGILWDNTNYLLKNGNTQITSANSTFWNYSYTDYVNNNIITNYAQTNSSFETGAVGTVTPTGWSTPEMYFSNIPIALSSDCAISSTLVKDGTKSYKLAFQGSGGNFPLMKRSVGGVYMLGKITRTLALSNSGNLTKYTCSIWVRYADSYSKVINGESEKARIKTSANIFINSVPYQSIEASTVVLDTDTDWREIVIEFSTAHSSATLTVAIGATFSDGTDDVMSWAYFDSSKFIKVYLDNLVTYSANNFYELSDKGLFIFNSLNSYIKSGAEGLIVKGASIEGNDVLVRGNLTVLGQTQVVGGVATIPYGYEPTNWNTAYVHTSNTSNPHSVTKTQVGLSNVTNDAQLKIASNLSDLNNAATARTNLNVPTRTGGDASGTWGISISGTAANSTLFNNLSSSQFLRSDVNTSLNGILTINDLSTKTTFLSESFSGITTKKNKINFTCDTGSNDNGAIIHETAGDTGYTNKSVLHLAPSDDNSDGDYVAIHGYNQAETLKLHTSGKIETPSSISATLGFLGNASTASKWAAARTLTLGGDLTGNVSIDGSANVTLTGSVVSGNATTLNSLNSSQFLRSDVDATLNGYLTVNKSGIGRIYLGVDANDYIEIDSSEDTFKVITDNGTRLTIGSSGATFANAVTITGNLIVNGTTTTVNATTVEVADNLLLINRNEVGAGVTAGTAGIEVERGTSANYQFLFDESDDAFKIGMVGALQKVATRENSPTNDWFARWNNAQSRFDTYDLDVANIARKGQDNLFSADQTINKDLATLTIADDVTRLPAIVLLRGSGSFGSDTYGDWKIQNNASALEFVSGVNTTSTLRAALSTIGLKIGTGTATEALDVTGNIKASGSLTATTSINAPYLIQSTEGRGIIFNDVFKSVITSGSTAAYPLDIFHNAIIGRDGSNLATFKWSASHASFGSRGIRLDYGASGKGIIFYADAVATTANSTFTPTQRMIIQNDGKVGIGLNPTELLDVAGSIKTSGNVIVSGTVTGVRTDTVDTADSSAVVISSFNSLTPSATRGASILVAGNEYATNPGSIRYYAGESGSHYLYVNGSVVEAISSTGVAITGTLSTSNSITQTLLGTVGYGLITSFSGVYENGYLSHIAKDVSNNQIWRASWKRNSSSTSYFLQFLDSTDTFYWNPIWFDYTNKRVGINNSSPAETLDVTGNIKLSQNIYAGASIYASGNYFVAGNTTSNNTYINYSSGWNFRVGSNYTSYSFAEGLSVFGNTSYAGNNIFRVVANDSYTSSIEVIGANQGTGVVYVGQSSAYGGGIYYSGDDTPTSMSGIDKFVIFRRSNSVDSPILEIQQDGSGGLKSYNHFIPNATATYYLGVAGAGWRKLVIEHTTNSAQGISLLGTGANTTSPRLFFQQAGSAFAMFNYGGSLSFNYGAVADSSSGSASMQMDSSGNLKFHKVLSSSSYTSGVMGNGWFLDAPNSYLEIDNIVIRKALRTHIFQKDVVRAMNGYFLFADSGVIISATATTVRFRNDKSASFTAGTSLWVKDIKESTGLAISSVIFTVDNPLVTTTGTTNGVAWTEYNVTFTSGTYSDLEDGMVAVRNNGSRIYMDATSNTTTPYIDLYNDSGVMTRLGNLSGMSSPTFGTLSDNGLWSKNIYAEGNVNIAGTLSAGDSRGFANTFLAGRINKNLTRYSSGYFTTFRWAINSWASETFSYPSTDSPFGTEQVTRATLTSGTELYLKILPYKDTGYIPNADKALKMSFSFWIRANKSMSANIRRCSTSFTEYSANDYYAVETGWQRITIENFDFTNLTTTNGAFLLHITSLATSDWIEITGGQLEYGAYCTSYQVNDGTLSSTDGYGMWAVLGGFGNTMQNPKVFIDSSGLKVNLSGSYYTRIGETPVSSYGGFYIGDGTNHLVQFDSNGTNKVAGWTVSTTTLANGTNIILDSSNKKISINSATFGADGIQLDYNAGNPRAYIGDGSTKYFQFDGTDVFWSGVNTSLTKAGLFTATNAVITGQITANSGSIAGWSITDKIIRKQFGSTNAKYITLSTDTTVDTQGALGYSIYFNDTETTANGIKCIRIGQVSDAGNLSSFSGDYYGMQIWKRISSTSKEVFRVAEDSTHIAGWNFTDTYLGKHWSEDSYWQNFYLSTATNTGGNFYTGESYKLQGLVQTWYRASNAGVIVFGQMLNTGSTLKTGYFGIQMMNHLGQEYFALGADTKTSGTLTVYNRIAGWEFNNTTISKGTVSLTSGTNSYLSIGQSTKAYNNAGIYLGDDNGTTHFSLVGASDNSLLFAGGGTIALSSTNFSLKGSTTLLLNTTTLALGTSASTLSLTAGTGVYANSSGHFKAGSDDSYIRWNGSGLETSGTLAVSDADGYNTSFYAGRLKKNIIYTTNSTVVSSGYINTTCPHLSASNYGSGTYSVGYEATVGINGLSQTVPYVSRGATGTGDSRFFYDGTNGYGYTGSSLSLTFSVWLKVRDGLGTASACQIRISQTGDTSGAATNFDLPDDGKWHRIKVTGTWASAPTSGRIYLNIPINRSIYASGVQVEEGTSMTAYQESDVTKPVAQGYGMWSSSGGFGGTLNNPKILADNSGLKVNLNGNYYVRLGETPLSSSKGLYIGDGTNHLVQFLSDGTNKIAGWTFDTTKLSSSGFEIDSASKIIRTNNTSSDRLELRQNGLYYIDQTHSLLGNLWFGYNATLNALSAVFSTNVHSNIGFTTSGVIESALVNGTFSSSNTYYAKAANIILDDAQEALYYSNLYPGITISRDTNLYRASANVLKTDDTFYATGKLGFSSSYYFEIAESKFYCSAGINVNGSAQATYFIGSGSSLSSVSKLLNKTNAIAEEDIAFTGTQLYSYSVGAGVIGTSGVLKIQIIGYIKTLYTGGTVGIEVLLGGTRVGYSTYSMPATATVNFEQNTTISNNNSASAQISSNILSMLITMQQSVLTTSVNTANAQSLTIKLYGVNGYQTRASLSSVLVELVN